MLKVSLKIDFVLLHIHSVSLIFVFLLQFVEMLVRNLKEALKTGEYENARIMVSNSLML